MKKAFTILFLTLCFNLLPNVKVIANEAYIFDTQENQIVYRIFDDNGDFLLEKQSRW